MSTYMPIIDALKSGFIKPEDFVAYTPDEKRRMYTKGVLFRPEEKALKLKLASKEEKNE